MITDYEHFLDIAKQGKKVPSEVISSIREQLTKKNLEGDPYTLIHILGRTGDIQSRSIIEQYLDFGLDDPNDDGMIRRISIQVLGRFWALPDMFSKVVEFAFNDPSPYVRSVAATIIGFLGSRHPHLKAKAASMLLTGFENQKKQDQEVWESFYDGILELLNVPEIDWPTVSRELADHDIRWDLLEKVRQIAAK